MTFTKKNTFSGGSNGVAISTANSGGASGDAFQLADSATYTTTNATGMRAPLVAAFNGLTQVRWSSLSMTGRTIYAREYVYLTSYDATASTIIAFGSTFARVRIDANGTVFITDASNALVSGTTTSAIPLNQWARIEASISIGTTTSNGSCELRLYLDADSSTPASTKTASGVNFGTSLATAVTFLAFNGVYADDLGVSDVGWIGSDRVDVSVTSSTLTGTWSLPAPAISTGSSAAPATIDTAWSLPDPEVVTADGLTPVNPNRIESAWSLPAPTVEAFRNVTVTPATVESTWQVLDPFAGVPVNPGDKLVKPGQIEWNGFVLGADTPYRLQQLDGWITDMPNLDSTNVAQPNRHGSYSGRKYSQERTVTLSGLIRTRREDMEQVVQALIRETTVLQDDTELPLAIRLLDTIYVGYGSVLRRSIPVDKNYRLGQARLTLQWVLSDPLLLSRELNSAVIGDGNTATLTNLGNAETYPTVRIPGPSVNPAVEIESGGVDRLLEFSLTVSSGQTLIIDPYYGTTMVGSTDVQGTLSGSSTAITDMVLPTGPSRMTYDGGGSAPDITVLWRHAHL